MSNVPSEPGEYVVTWPNGRKRVVLLDRDGYAALLSDTGSTSVAPVATISPDATWNPIAPQVETQLVEAGKVQGVGVLHLVDDEGEIRFFRVKDARAAEKVIDGLIAVHRLSDRLEALEDAELGDVIRWATGEDRLVVIRPRESDITLYASKPIVEEPVAPEPEPAVAAPVEPWSTEFPTEPGGYAIEFPEGTTCLAIASVKMGVEICVYWLTAGSLRGGEGRGYPLFAGCRFQRLHWTTPPPRPVVPKPCPCCGSEKADPPAMGVNVVNCLECELSTDEYATPEEAVAAWNKRA